jgi:N-dimethylarginine dimethylaminohydrolase
MRSWGRSTAFGDLVRVIVHRPGVELSAVTARTLEDFNFDRPVDPERFTAEYDGMLDLFRSQGTEPLLLREILRDDVDAQRYMDHRPNMTYTRDLAAVFASGAVLMRPHLRGRWGDQEMLARAFTRLGVPILGSIEPPGFLEGGGVTIIGDDTVVASICDRANDTGTRMLRELLLGRDVGHFLEVPLPRGHVHIDGLFMMLDEDLCIVHEPSLSVYPCRLYEAGRDGYRHVMFMDYLDSRGMKTIPITDDEHRAGSLNMVVTQRGKTAVGYRQTAPLQPALERHGWQLVTFDSSEMTAGKGGAHCMTCPLLYR